MWPLSLIVAPYLDVIRYVMKPGHEAYERRVGDCWFAPELLQEQQAPWHQISPAYKRDWLGRRDPLIVILPGLSSFCVDACAWREGTPYGNGWVVTGEVPNITVSPSISIGGAYHGWIRDGVITPDCEGRTYAPDGRPVR